MPGMCLVLQIDDTNQNNASDPSINVKIYVDTRDGKTNAQGRLQKDPATSQMTAPSTALPSFDRYSKNPNARAVDMWGR